MRPQRMNGYLQELDPRFQEQKAFQERGKLFPEGLSSNLEIFRKVLQF